MTPLQQMTSNWNRELETALRRHDNALRTDQRLQPYPDTTPVFLPTGHKASLLWLNWKVWSIRYCVSVDFILTTLLQCYRNLRKPSNNEICLGLPPNVLTSARARERLEEAVSRTFPNGENYRSARQAPVPPPLIGLKYNELEDFVAAYSKHMERRQRAIRRPEPKYRRNFRRA